MAAPRERRRARLPAGEALSASSREHRRRQRGHLPVLGPTKRRWISMGLADVAVVQQRGVTVDIPKIPRVKGLVHDSQRGALPRAQGLAGTSRWSPRSGQVLQRVSDRQNGNVFLLQGTQILLTSTHWPSRSLAQGKGLVKRHRAHVG